VVLAHLHVLRDVPAQVARGRELARAALRIAEAGERVLGVRGDSLEALFVRLARAARDQCETLGALGVETVDARGREREGWAYGPSFALLDWSMVDASTASAIAPNTRTIAVPAASGGLMMRRVRRNSQAWMAISRINATTSSQKIALYVSYAESDAAL